MSTPPNPRLEPSARSDRTRSVVLLLAALLGIALFIRLGLWQLDRAGQKRELMEQYAAGQQSEVELTTENADTLTRYQRVRAEGKYDPAHQVLLDNMPSPSGPSPSGPSPSGPAPSGPAPGPTPREPATRAPAPNSTAQSAATSSPAASTPGWPGYRVLTPFELSGGGWLLVDRGWLPMGRTRADLPDISVGDQPRTITGTLDALPRAGLQMDSVASSRDAPWPRVLNFPQQPALEATLGRKVLPGLVRLDASQPDGYARHWQAQMGVGPQRHIAYAVQWFALAAALAVIYLVVTFRSRNQRADERSD